MDAFINWPTFVFRLDSYTLARLRWNMPDHKFEISVEKDANNVEAHLDGMSIEAAKSFAILLQAMVEIANNSELGNTVEVKISEGSATAGIYPTADAGQTGTIAIPISPILENYKSVIDRETNDSKTVAPWLTIQKLFKQNGVIYRAAFEIDSQVIPIYDEMKAAPAFRAKRKTKRINPEVEIKFYQKELVEAGGKSKSNLHFVDDQDRYITVSCEKENARIARNYLYEDIRMSVWITKGPSNEFKYELCDVYRNADAFEELKAFIEEFQTKEAVDDCQFLHRYLKQYLIERNFRRVKRVMRLFIHENTDINYLKTILLITNVFKDNELDTQWREMHSLYTEKYNKL